MRRNAHRPFRDPVAPDPLIAAVVTPIEDGTEIGRLRRFNSGSHLDKWLVSFLRYVFVESANARSLTAADRSVLHGQTGASVYSRRWVLARLAVSPDEWATGAGVPTASAAAVVKSLRGECAALGDGQAFSLAILIRSRAGVTGSFAAFDTAFRLHALHQILTAERGAGTTFPPRVFYTRLRAVYRDAGYTLPEKCANGRVQNEIQLGVGNGLTNHKSYKEREPGYDKRRLPSEDPSGE